MQVCQLQLKICTKLIEFASPSSTHQQQHHVKPSSLKRLAGRSILSHSGSNAAGIGFFGRQQGYLIDECHGIHQVLPCELIQYLRDGANDSD